MLTLTPPHLHVLVPNFHASIESLERNSLASVRLRSALMARAAERLGWRVTVCERFDTLPDYLYVGKIGAHDIERRQPLWLQYIKNVKANGSTVIIDYSDHHLGIDSAMKEFYKNAIIHADTWVTPSVEMTQRLKPMCSGTICEIPDPCEIDHISPRAAGPAPWRALWFGSHVNIRYLTAFLGEKRNLRNLREINIVTNNNGFQQLVTWRRSIASDIALPPTRVFDWSLPNLLQAAASSDIALIPSDPFDPRKAGVSENRLITSLQLGLTTVACPMPSYLPYQHLFVPISENWPQELSIFDRTRMRQSDDLIELSRLFSKESVTARWTQLLEAVSRCNYRDSAARFIADRISHE